MIITKKLEPIWLENHEITQLYKEIASIINNCLTHEYPALYELREALHELTYYQEQKD